MQTILRRRLDRELLFQELGYAPHPGQQLVHRSTAPRRVLACGSRWGKSTCAAMEALAALLEPRESARGWVVAATYDLTQRTFQRVTRVFEERLRHRIQEVVTRDQMIRVLNVGGGISELRCKSADNPVSLLGEGLDWVIVDEAASLKAEIWEQRLAQRLIDKRGWALFLSTPKGLDWFYRLYRLGQKGRDPQFESWASPSWDNPHLDRAVIEAERTRSPREVFDQEYGAVFIGEQEEPCERCGCPSVTAPGLIVWDKDEQPELPKCSECGNIVDENGRSVVRRGPDGKGYLKIIWYEGDDDDPRWNGIDPPKRAAS